MECKDCHLGNPVKGLINKYTCGLDHGEEKKVRNGWDGCNVVESVGAREHATRLSCPECGKSCILVETKLPTVRTVTERPLEPPTHQSRLIDSRLEKTGKPERTFICEDCGHRWPVPDWFPEVWEAKPDDIGHMTIEELTSHLKDKILGGMGIPRRYVSGTPEREREPVPDYPDDQLLSPKALRDSYRCPVLQARVIDALYEECVPFMPREDEAEQPVFGPGSIAHDGSNGDVGILHERMAKVLKGD